MVIVRAPVRISFGGGGTDLAAYYLHFGGFVVSTAITRYCYDFTGARVLAASEPGTHLTSQLNHLYERVGRE